MGTVHHAKDDKPQRPILLAHRGANRLADENTLKAYALAAAHGMDYFECDPRLTKDGVFIIMHDSSLKRSTGDKRKVETLTLAEVSEVTTTHGEPIPTLEQAFDLAKEKDIKVYLDTKLRDVPSMEKLLDFVKAQDMADRVMVGLWTREQQVWMHENHPDVATSLSYPTPVPGLKKVRELGAQWVGMLVPQATNGVINKSHRYGLKVVTMPINDEKTMRSKIQAGMDVIQTDDVLLLRDVILDIFGPEAFPE